jgi:DNA-binding MarR family transcriptional regulator
MTAGSDRVGRHFARQHDLHRSDLQALLHIMVAETAGEPLNSSQLRERMDISNAAITYLVDRVVSAGHIRREADPSDRRKSLHRLESHAMALGGEFSVNSVPICTRQSTICPTMICLPATGC